MRCVMPDSDLKFQLAGVGVRERGAREIVDLFAGAPVGSLGHVRWIL